MSNETNEDFLAKAHAQYLMWSQKSKRPDKPLKEPEEITPFIEYIHALINRGEKP